MAFNRLYEGKNGFTFYWKIKHFSLCSLLYKNGIIKSPVFCVEEIENSNWYLDLFFDDTSSISLNIERHDENKRLVSVDVKLFLLKTNGDNVIEEKENASFKSHQDLDSPLHQELSEIFENKEIFLPGDTLTVGCVLKKHSPDHVTVSAVCTACTVIPAETISFVYPFNISQPEEIITVSKPSLSKRYPNFKIIIETVFFAKNPECMNVKIEMAKWNTRVLCKCKLSVKNKNNKALFLFEDYHFFNERYLSWNLTNSALLEEGMPNALEDCSLLLHCKLDISEIAYSSYIEDLIYHASDCQTKQRSFSSIPSELSLKEKLKCLHADSRLCDFTFQVDGEEFPVHKAVLGAVSPVFCAMFEREMREKEKSLCVIKDVDASTIQKLISFAYTECVENLEWESAIKLYCAAEKYQISELKKCCSIFLIANLTIENVTEVLAISDMYQDDNLETEAGNFVLAHGKEVFRSDSWQAFIESKMTVANKVMQKMCLQYTSNLIF